VEYQPITCVVASSNQLSTEVGEDAIVLDFNQDAYFGIEGAGAFIWHLVQQPISVALISAAVISEFDVEESRAQTDVVAFLRQLEDNHLIDVVETPSDPVT
jgi:hypothetical protein